MGKGENFPGRRNMYIGRRLAGKKTWMWLVTSGVENWTWRLGHTRPERWLKKMTLNLFWSVTCTRWKLWSLRALPCLSRNPGATLVRAAVDSHAHISGHCHCPPQAPRHPGLNRFHNSPVDIFGRVTTHVVSSGSFQRKYEYLHRHFFVYIQVGMPSILPRILACASGAEKYYLGQLLK